MPIYEYLCNSCGVQKEHIQKMNDAPIKTCPSCGSEKYIKLVSAAGFQLKGTGWYVTDFKNKPSQSAPKSTKQNDSQTQASDPKTDSTTATTSKDNKPNSTATTAAAD